MFPVKAPIVDVISETRDQIIYGLEEREARARQRKVGITVFKSGTSSP